MPTAPGRPYTAFISYSHEDVEVARWLHRRLEAYDVPKVLQGRPTLFGPVPQRLGRFFRDRDELPAGGGLSAHIQQALADAAFLIVLCSPASASSAWVEREIKEFRALGRDDRILLVNVSGEPPATFPPSLTSLDPIVADLQNAGDGRELGFLKLVAGLIGVPLGELKDREAEAARLRGRRRAYIIGTLAVLLAFSLAGLGGTFLYAKRSESLAREAIHISGQIADDAMTLGLNEQIPIGAIESFTRSAIKRIDELEQDGVDIPELRSRRAWLFARFAHVAEMKDDAVAMEQYANRALALVRGSEQFEDLLTTATALSSLATSKSLRGDFAGARNDAAQSVTVSRKAVRLYSQKYQSRLMLAETLLGLGAEEAEHNVEASLSAYSESIMLFRQLFREQPDSATFQMRLAEQLESIGDIHTSRGEQEKALAAYREGVDMARRYLKWNTPKPSAHQKVARLLFKVARASTADRASACKEVSSIAQEMVSTKRAFLKTDDELLEWLTLLKQSGELCADAGEGAFALAAFEACMPLEQELALRRRDLANLKEQRVVTYLFATSVAVDGGEPMKARFYLDTAESLLVTSDDWPENERLRRLYQQVYRIRQEFLPETMRRTPIDADLPVED